MSFSFLFYDDNFIMNVVKSDIAKALSGQLIGLRLRRVGLSAKF